MHLGRVTWKQSLRQGLSAETLFGRCRPRVLRVKTEESEAGKGRVENKIKGILYYSLLHDDL